MNKYNIVRKIEEFAPLETQENWDCSGWVVDTSLQNFVQQSRAIGGANGATSNLHLSDSNSAKNLLFRQGEEVSKILFALTVTDDVVRQAREKNCEMIISHHPLFCVPLEYGDIDIYCAHTNLDIAEGGTTDILIKKLGFQKTRNDGFVRIVELDSPITVEELRERLLTISPKLRYVNNCGVKTIHSIGFCAGSGSEFIGETDAFVTGDLKFHTALDSKKVVFDIGHFESEVFVPELLKEITGVVERGIIADEKSPFI